MRFARRLAEPHPMSNYAVRLSRRIENCKLAIVSSVVGLPVSSLWMQTERDVPSHDL